MRNDLERFYVNLAAWDGHVKATVGDVLQLEKDDHDLDELIL